MKKVLGVIVVIVCTVLMTGCNFVADMNNNVSTYSASKISSKDYSSTQELLASVSPSVVAILSTTSSYQSIGSGVCVNEKGYVLTNNHVVEGANSLKLYLYDGSTCNASLVWRDSSLDLAVIKATSKLPYLEMAEDSEYSVGEEVVAIGTPISLSFKHSATKGMISAKNRTIQVENDNKESVLANLIQHDASINPGNSGGPLINMKGKVIGINTVKVTDAEGMGFAIPISIGKKVVTRLSANGDFDTAYLGVMGYSACFKTLGSTDKGYKIVSIDKNSPASKLGLQVGDVITRFDGVDVDSGLDIRLKLYDKNSGDNATICFKRDDKYFVKTIKLTSNPNMYKYTKLNKNDFGVE